MNSSVFFFRKLQGFTCLTNVIRLQCCLAFCHKTCQDTSAKSWKKCGHCRFPFKNIEGHDVEINDSLTGIGDQEHPENVTSSLDEAAPVLPASHIRQNSREQFMELRDLINEMEVIEQLLSFQPSGYSETVGEYFCIQNNTEFRQKMALLCAHSVQEGFELEKIFIVIRFDNPRRFRLHFEHLKRLLFPFFRLIRTLLARTDHTILDKQMVFTLSAHGCKCVGFELTARGAMFNTTVPEWPTLLHSP